jgi:hypothetical protein
MRIAFTLDQSQSDIITPIPAINPPIPSHYGREPVHQNDVLRNRSKARKLWKLLSRRLSA